MKHQPKSSKSAHPKHARPLTFHYIFFYALFWPETYRLLIGLLAGAFVAPLLFAPDLGNGGKILLFFMIATIGYALSGAPGRAIAAFFRKRILQ